MKILKIILGIFVAFFLVVGVPVIINECYKANCGYITVWDGADVLGYYGGILGSVIAVITLVATIIFTKKQIQRERFLKSEEEKWDRLDRIFLEILDSINPIKVLQSVMDNGYNAPSIAINCLQKYQMSCKVACDQLNAYLNIEDYPKFKNLIDTIAHQSNLFVDISQEAVEQYSDFRLWNYRDTALDMLKVENQYPGSHKADAITYSKEALDKTKDMTFSSIDARIKEVNEKFIKTYEEDYRSLLQLKGSTFEIVRRETESKADNILNLRRK